MKIRAVIFDLDNTLIDFMKFKKACINAAVDKMISKGLNISRDDAIKVIFDLYDKYGMEHQQIFQPFLEKVKGKLDWKLLAYGISAYRAEKVKYMKPYSNVISTLKKLKKKGIKLAILTDAPKFQAYVRLADLDLLDYFNTIITFDDTGRRKPHPAPFKAVLKALNMKPSEVLMVGDAPQWDIKGAKAAGMKTALAVYGLIPHKDAKKAKVGPKADFELKDISDLLKIV